MHKCVYVCVKVRSFADSKCCSLCCRCQSCSFYGDVYKLSRMVGTRGVSNPARVTNNSEAISALSCSCRAKQCGRVLYSAYIYVWVYVKTRRGKQ